MRYDITDVMGKKTQSEYKASTAIVKNCKDWTFETQLLVKAQTLLKVNLKQYIELVCKKWSSYII